MIRPSAHAMFTMFIGFTVTLGMVIAGLYAVVNAQEAPGMWFLGAGVMAVASSIIAACIDSDGQ